jgi:MYXO-CTERM domain-containing protein
VVGEDGRFAFEGVGVGAHAVDASGAGLVATTLPFEQAVYPGTRLVVVLDPESADTTGADTSGGGESDGGGTDDAGDDDGIADDGTDDGDGDDGIDPGLPATFGESGDPAAGCACRAGDRGPHRAALPLVLALAAVARRRPGPARG